MPSSCILLSISDGVAEVTLNRPDKLNSFTRVMHAELRAALAAIRNDTSVRAILLTGAGRGNSLAEQLAPEADLQSTAAQSHDYHEGVAAFLAKRKPVFEGR